MKRGFFIAACLLFIAHYSIGQSNTGLTVLLRSPGNDTISNLNLQLFLLPDTTLMKSQAAQDNGNRFTVKKFSKYIVRVTGIGYEKTERVIGIAYKPLVITVTVKRTTKSLEQVVVVSRKPFLKQEDDKTIVDAEVLANSSSNAYEVLEKTPGVIIDQDGNVYLNSMTPSTVFINGREIKLSSTDLASLLKSLPAGSVSKIEILRNPSAKYDAASSGGILNIVLKKGVKLGSNGSINAALFQGVYSTQTLGVNLNKSAGKINSYFSYQFTNRNNFEELLSNRAIKSDSTLLSQKAYTTYPSSNHYLAAGADIAFTKKINTAYDIRMSITDGKSQALNETNIYKDPLQLQLSNNRSDIGNRNSSLFIAHSLSSKYKIDTTGSELTVDIDYDHFHYTNAQDYTNAFLFPAKPTASGDGKNNNTKNIFSFKSDLTLKMPRKITLEAGFKATLGKSENAAAYFYDTGNNIRQPDVFQTNTFTYRESISAAYLQMSKTFYGFTLKPGMRLETTDINGRQSIPKDTSISLKRTDLFPYVYLRHKLFKLFGFDLIGNAIYRRSIRRPYYEILNPYPKFIDPYLYDVGNPKIKPQFTTNYEINVTFDDFPVFALGINQTKDIFSNVTYQDELTKIAYRTWDNLGKNKEYYFRVIGGVPPGGKYFFYLGVQYNYNEYKGVYQNLPLNYKRGSWLFFLHQEYKLSRSFILDMHGFMRTKALQNFYELDNFGGLFLSANKSLFNKKANIIFSVNDVLRTNHVSFRLNQGNVSAQGSRINDTRKAGITFRYNFGLSKPKEQKQFGTPVED